MACESSEIDDQTAETRLIGGFEISFRRGSIRADDLANELERIARLLREGYVEGQLFSQSGYDGYWTSTEAVIP